MNSPVIRAESVVACYGKQTVLQIPHLSVEKGEVLAVIGPNGAGKSTLLQVLGLLHRPLHGRLFFDGQDVTDPSNIVALRRRMALVFQKPLLFRGSVFDNVTLGLRLRRLPKGEIVRRAERWLAKLNISHLADRSAAKLSVGEAQRVNLARSLALNPDLFLLDEPFASLDPPTQASMVEEFQNILGETKTTTVLVTHSRSEALMLGHRLAVLINGQMAQLDRPENVFSHPASREVAAFLGVETLVKGRVLSTADGISKVAMAHHQVMVAGSYPPEEEQLFCLRPEDISLFLPESRAEIQSDLNVISGTVMRVVPMETQFKVIVNCSFPVTVLVSKQEFIDLSLARDKQVLLAFKPRTVHAIPKI